MILTIVQGLIFLSYVIFLMIRFKGPLPSISDSWYKLNGMTSILFILFCWSLSITMVLQSNGIILPFFISGSGLAFVGVSTAFKDKENFTSLVHFAGAAICIIFAFIGIWLEYNLWLLSILWIMSIIIFNKLKIKNTMWWVEISAFLFIIIGLFIK